MKVLNYEEFVDAVFDVFADEYLGWLPPLVVVPITLAVLVAATSAFVVYWLVTKALVPIKFHP